MTNPFENPNSTYVVLINEEGQYSLWPTFTDVPGGWSVAFGEATREDCLAYIEKNWTDLRPKSLIAAEQGDR